MELISLKLQNFKKYREKVFEFKNGFTGIVGKNGSGKSTIFEAIRFALFGSTQTKKELLKNVLVSRENLKVELEFIFEDKEYLVAREYRGASNKAVATIYENSLLKASDVKSVNLFIKQLIKIDEKAFLSTVFSSQKELMKLSTMRSEERKSMIRELLGFEKIDKVQKNIKENIKALKTKIESFNSILMSEEEENNKLELIENEKKEILVLEQELLKYQNEKQTILSEIEIVEKSLEIMSKNRDKKQNQESKKELLKSTILHKQKTFEEKEKSLQNIEQKEKDYKENSYYKSEYERIQIEIDELNRIKGKAQNRKVFEEKDKNLREKYLKLGEEKDILQSELIDIKKIEEQTLITKNQISVLKNFEKSMLQKEKELNRQITENETKSDDLFKKLHKIERLGKKAICPTCNRPLEKEYDEVVHSLKKDIEGINRDKLEGLNYTLYQIKKKLEKLEQSLFLENKILEELENGELKYKKQSIKIESLEEKIKSMLKDIEENGSLLRDTLNIDFNEKEYEKKKILYEELKQKRDYLITLENEISKKENIQKESLSIQNELNELKDSLIKLENEKIEFDENEYKKTLENSKTVKLKKEEIQEKIHKLDIQKVSKNSIIEKTVLEIDENQKQKNRILEFIKDLNDYEKLDVVTKEFKNRLNSKVSPMITKKATYLFSKITDGKYSKLEIDDNFDIYIYDDGERYFIDRFSGGEIDLANLVLRIAISQTIMELNSSTQISFLAFDEIFGSQDEGRREMILRAFYEIKEQFREIFVISHEDDIKDNFENVIEL